MMADLLVLAVALLLAVGVVLLARPPKAIPMSQAVQWRVDAIPKPPDHEHFAAEEYIGTAAWGQCHECGLSAPRRKLRDGFPMFDGQGERL